MFWFIQKATRVNLVLCLTVVSAITGTAGQHKVDPANSYQRIIAVVPLVGKGTYDDPKRPMYAPTFKRIAGNRSGIIAFSQQPTDDKKSAIVEFIATDLAA